MAFAVRRALLLGGCNAFLLGDCSDRLLGCCSTVLLSVYDCVSDAPLRIVLHLELVAVFLQRPSR